MLQDENKVVGIGSQTKSVNEKERRLLHRPVIPKLTKTAKIRNSYDAPAESKSNSVFLKKSLELSLYSKTHFGKF